MTTDAAALIAECIAYEESERDAADPQDRHYWDGWDRELVRQGTPKVRIVTSAPGLGHTVRVSIYLVIELPDGRGDASVRDVDFRTVPAKWLHRKGREGYCRDVARRLYGNLPATYKALV